MTFRVWRQIAGHNDGYKDFKSREKAAEFVSKQKHGLYNFLLMTREPPSYKWEFCCYLIP